jgi:Flp pilus assembly protein TadG
MKIFSKKRQQGAVSVVVALSLLALLGVLGLAIDSGLGYMIRAKLDAAADGAAIAAGQAVTRGSDQATQIANARQAANAFFAANYPAGFLGSTATLDTSSITFNEGTVTIDLAAQAQVPVTFMRLFGFDILKVATASEAVRRDLDMAFIIDTTGSMTEDWSVPPAVRSSATTFLQQFDALADRVALLHFGLGTVVDQPFNGNARGFDMAAMKTSIEKMTFNGGTNSAEAYWNALNQLQSVITTPSSLRVIVFFSDGAPNSFTAIFGPNTASPACNSVAGTIATQDVSPADVPSSHPVGLYYDDQQFTMYPLPCFQAPISSLITQLPQWYNAHNTAWLDDHTIPVIKCSV